MNARIEPSANPPCIAALQNRSHQVHFVGIYRRHLPVKRNRHCIRAKRREVAFEPIIGESMELAIGCTILNFFVSFASKLFIIIK